MRLLGMEGTSGGTAKGNPLEPSRLGKWWDGFLSPAHSSLSRALIQQEIIADPYGQVGCLWERLLCSLCRKIQSTFYTISKATSKNCHNSYFLPHINQWRWNSAVSWRPMFWINVCLVLLCRQAYHQQDIFQQKTVQQDNQGIPCL